MKLSKFTIVLLFLSATALYAQDKQSEKTTDVSEFSVATRAASVGGALDASDDTFNRILGMGTVDLTCSGTGGAYSGVGNAVYYDVYEIYSPTGENLVCSVTSGNDSYLNLFCDPFNPADPLPTGRFTNDDGGVGLDAAFTSGDNVYLEPYTTYYLVVCSFDNGATFSYTLDIGGDVVVGTPLVPVSDWAVYFGILLIGIFTVYRFKVRMA